MPTGLVYRVVMIYFNRGRSMLRRPRWAAVAFHLPRGRKRSEVKEMRLGVRWQDEKVAEYIRRKDLRRSFGTARVGSHARVEARKTAFKTNVADRRKLSQSKGSNRLL